MKRLRQLQRKPLRPLQRYGLLSVGIGAVILGAGSLGLGNLHYTNTQGEAVFAPFAIVIGALLILVTLRWDKTLQDNQHKK
jgi:hypothetical protein